MADGAFFLSPEQALAAEAQMRQQSAMQAGATPLGATGQELGRSISGAFGRAFGAAPQESPEVALARTRQGVIQGLDPSDPNTFMEGARALYSAGDMQGAISLITQGQALTKGEPEVKAYKPGEVLYKGARQVGVVPGEVLDKTTMDDYTRALAKRNELRDKLRTSPKDAGLLRDLKDTDARIARLTTITGRTPQDISANLRVKMGAELDNMQQTLDQLGSLADEYALNPNAAGTVGALKETMGGLAEQFLGETGTQISAGLGTEKARQIRTKTRLALGKLLPVITGDTSGRYTDKEKEFAEETLGGLDKMTSDKAVETSLREIIKVLEESERRMAQRLGKTAPDSQPSITTQEEYDNLPAGASYLYNGQLYTKGR